MSDIKVRVGEALKNALQTVIQYGAAANEARTPLSRVLGGLDLSTIHWHSPPGAVVRALFRFAGFEYSDNGKRLWRTVEPELLLEHRPPEKGGSLRPAEPRVTALGELDPVELQHDPAAASATATRAATAARPDAQPRVLELVKPDKADKLGARSGSGWGNSPRPLARCCVCEQERIDALVAIGEDHARAHPDHPPPRRVDLLCFVHINRERREASYWAVIF